jgi:AraC-like DNA-binding protein
MAHRTALSAQQIRTAIRDALRDCAVRPDAHPLTIVAIANDLSFSRSSVQRNLAEASTTFTAELRAARARAAVRAIYAGATVAEAAARVGLTPDHLRVVLLQEYGIAPGALRHCLRIARKLNSWRRTPERSGSSLYWRRLRDWRSFDVQLHRYFDPIPTTSALRSWADGVLAAAARPDYRRGVHRQIARDRREQERRAAGHRRRGRSSRAGQRKGAR